MIRAIARTALLGAAVTAALGLGAPGLAHADADADPDEIDMSEPAEAAPPVTPVTATPRARPRASSFYVWGGVAHVAPLASSRELELADVDGAASLAVQNGPIAGSGAAISSATIPALIVGYVLPVAQRRLALETVLGVPFTVKFRATGTLANESLAPMALGIPTGVPPLGSELGEAKAAPPVVTAVYKLRPGRAVTPYVGAGLAVLFAYDAKVTNPMLTEVGQPDVRGLARPWPRAPGRRRGDALAQRSTRGSTSSSSR